MKIVADVHLHSYFSRATSKNLNLEYLSKWAQLKGVHVVGTGDIAHPGWLAEMRDRLEPAEEGLFRLKPEVARAIEPEVPKACKAPVRFMLAGEISNIYKKNDKVRKIHNVVFMPSFEALEKFQARLETIGNIRSDGRPILGLDSRDLLEIVLETDPQGYLIPAHIWTPWFALLGSMSGFDSVAECFGDLTDHIFAVETGLSSDPPMNWRLSILDRYTLVSNSDAHSPPKLAREANVFDTELSYPALFQALKTGSREEFLGTIEFFPEEGKYHYDGHRKCNIRWDPKETLAHDALCPVCGKKVTVGVMHRVEELADREHGEAPEGRHPYKSLVPLPEVLAEIHQVGVNSKRVQEGYEFLLAKLGSELFILQEAPLEDIEKLGGAMVAEGIKRMRSGELQIKAGFDGEYGVIRLFDDKERKRFSAQLGFFVENVKQAREETQAQTKVAEPAQPYQKQQIEETSAGKNARKAHTGNSQSESTQTTTSEVADLNPQQKAAVAHGAGPLLIVAGPGTGKTRTLAYRIASLIQNGIQPVNILALTFTNKAAEEMTARLQSLVGAAKLHDLTVGTFHAFGVRVLLEAGRQIDIAPDFAICSEQDRQDILRGLCRDASQQELSAILETISLTKNLLLSPETVAQDQRLPDPARFPEIHAAYQSALRRLNAVDFDDLLYLPLKLFRQFPEVQTQFRQRFQWILVDEYQDVNRAQYELLHALTDYEANICAIGDPEQAIYGFRGASREFFLNFQQDFPDAVAVNLAQNYRSTQTILDASTQILQNKSEKNGHDLWSEIVSTTLVERYTAPTDKAEAEFVVHSVEKLVGGTSYFSIDSGRVNSDDEKPVISFGDVAVLYRLRAQARLLREAFDRSGMPYQTAGETTFWDKSGIRALLDVLWSCANPNDNLHLQKIMKHPKSGLGASTAEQVIAQANRDRAPLWHALQKPGQTVNDRQEEAIYQFTGKLTRIHSEVGLASVVDLVDLVVATFPQLAFDLKDDKMRQRLARKAQPFESDLRAFLRTVALSSDADEYDPRADCVSLMTLHAAKGLEFPVVFIVGCEEELLPYFRDGKQTDVEEERRLLYVGMTRAREKLILTDTKTRVLFGKKKHPEPSRFLRGIERALLQVKQAEHREKKQKMKNPQTELF